MYIKTVDESKCTSCMKCAAICTNSQVIVQNDAGIPEFLYDNKCILCGHCMAICPEGAITFTPMQNDCTRNGAYCAEAIERNADQVPLKPDAVFDFLCATRSNRIFKDQPVEREKLKRIVDAMTRAASAGNEQNRNYYVITDPEILGLVERSLAAHFSRKLKSVQNPASRAMLSFFSAIRAGKQDMGTLETSKMPFKQRYGLMQAMLLNALPKSGSAFSYLKHAPVLVIVTEGKKKSAMYKAFYRGDACISVTYGILMAKALGLASCWIGLLEIALSQDAALGRIFKLKPGEKVDAAVALGYSDLKWYRLPPRGPVEITWLP